jgi:hypothetical protein
MSKTIKDRDGPVLGIYSSKDMFEKLKYESLRLQKNWQNPYDSFNFLVTAWHLFNDWPKSDDRHNLSRIKRQKNQLPSEMRLVLDITRDLTNGGKHFMLDPKAAKNRRVDVVHTGNEMDYYEYFFHEDLPAVTVETHWYLSIRILHNILIHYFTWVFNDSILANNFPSEISEAILYCNIAERPAGPSPAIWLEGIEGAYPQRK